MSEPLYKSIRKANSIYLFTNRNTMVFDDRGKQIPEYQKAISCYSLNKKLALQAIQEATKFYIAKWRRWEWEITRKEMQYLLGLRTRVMDIKEVADEK